MVADFARMLTRDNPYGTPRQRAFRLVTTTITGGELTLSAAAKQSPSIDPVTVPTMHLRLTGSFQLIVGGETVRVSIGSQRLLALLALRAGGTSRAFVARTLWPGLPRSRAWANCRTALHRLVRQCGPVVRAGTDLLRLEPAVVVDIRHVARVAKRLLDPSCDLDQAFLTTSLDCSLYEDLLPEWHDDWLTADRARFRELRLHCLEALARRLAAAGRYGAAIDAAFAALQADTMRESAHEELIKAHLAEGNRNEAIRHFTTYCRIMREELGLDPASRIADLVWLRGQKSPAARHVTG